MYYQELLLQEYPPDSLDNLEIWSIVPFHKMIESVRMQVQCICRISSTPFTLSPFLYLHE